MSAGDAVTGVRHVLLFDATCSHCAAIARLTEQLSKARIDTLALSNQQARELLDEALRDNWSHQPYLVSTNGVDVRAYAGWALGWQLLRILGPSRSWIVWRQLRQRTQLRNSLPYHRLRRQLPK